jgi:ribosomal protein S18 acetylase RimI-like enzyme
MMRIEELDTSHSPLVTALWDIVGLTRAWNDPHDDFVRALGGLTSTVLGAFDGDDLVGTVMVGYDGHRGWIYYLAVAPECQHTGVGTSLMKAGEHWLREHGAVKVQLMVRKANHQVTGFYEHLGYEESPTTVFARWLHEVS